MRVGFHYHVPVVCRDSQIRMPAYFGLFIDSIAGFCDKLIFYANSPVKSEITRMDYVIKSTNLEVVNLGPHLTIPLRILRALPAIPKIMQCQKCLDVLFLRAPTPLLPLFRLVWKKPTVLLLVADDVAGIDNLPQPPWRKKLIRWWTLFNFSQQMKLSKNSLVFVNSKMLYEKYKNDIPNLIQTQTTTLRKNDFFIRSDTCKTQPYHLLFTGRLSRMKGLFDILTAVKNVYLEGFDVILDIVGMVDKSDPILDSLFKQAKSYGIADRVIYHGYKKAGEELLEFYRNADIYVIAPQSNSEGFPRTIWEAMASSTPVVATNVSSIKAFSNGAAILVEPKDPKGLTEAIKKLLTNSGLRKSLISKGMTLAKNNTLEKRSDELMSKVKFWVNGEKTL
ncbi:MAG: glycosyltransferase family 4 protein [Candidatus Helarchaeota archaeon]